MIKILRKNTWIYKNNGMKKRALRLVSQLVQKQLKMIILRLMRAFKNSK